MKGIQGSVSGSPISATAVAEHDWAAGWDAHPLTAASPRWTFGNSDKIKPKRRNEARLKVTYIDHVSKAVAWVPGPGTHRTRRNFDSYPEDNEGGDPERVEPKEQPRMPRWQDVCDRQVYQKFSRSTRQASLPDLRKVRTTLLPTNFLSPGPGAYTAYSTFGAPSGPTRKRFFATAKSDSAIVRPVEEFNKYSSRGLEGRNFSQQRVKK